MPLLHWSKLEKRRSSCGARTIFAHFAHAGANRQVKMFERFGGEDDGERCRHDGWTRLYRRSGDGTVQEGPASDGRVRRSKKSARPFFACVPFLTELRLQQATHSTPVATRQSGVGGVVGLQGHENFQSAFRPL